MKTEEFNKLTLPEMKEELRNELSKIIVLTILINLIGWFSVFIFGWKIGIFIGLILLLIVLLLIREK